jgi:hypothetical protein
MFQTGADSVTNMTSMSMIPAVVDTMVVSIYGWGKYPTLQLLNINSYNISFIVTKTTPPSFVTSTTTMVNNNIVY